MHSLSIQWKITLFCWFFRTKLATELTKSLISVLAYSYKPIIIVEDDS